MMPLNSKEAVVDSGVNLLNCFYGLSCIKAARKRFNDFEKDLCSINLKI